MRMNAEPAGKPPFRRPSGSFRGRGRRGGRP
jgi:hypothetical protein